ncbi:MAG: AAA family ATPase [Candidatus Micrarchaeota archaeon]|nr:AAA family ATPase [Candidatus Micrarchaeota archaeon]
MEPTFDELLNKGDAIFKDKSVLSPHYVPETLLHREAELRKIMSCLAPALQGKKPSNTLIYGKTGSGKSICAKRVLQKLYDQKEASVSGVYLNCRVYDSRYKIVQKVVSDFDADVAKTGHSFSVLYEKVIDKLETESKHLVLVLDEIDVVKDLDTLVYTLTRANDDLKAGSISMVGISNKVTFKQKLDARSRSSLCEEEIVFPPYNALQLEAILSQRVPLAFRDNVLEQSGLNIAAAIAAGESGDARYALTLLLKAGELALSRGMKKVSDKEVEAARVAADEDKARELISSLPEHLQLVLYSLAVVSQDVQYKRLVEDDDGQKLFFSGEVYDRYSAMCKKMGKEPRSARWYREYLHELETLGLLISVHSGKGIRGQATLIKPVYPADKIRKVIEENLK